MGSRCIHLACMERILSFLRPCPASADVRRGGKHFQTATLSNDTMCELFLLHVGASHCMWKSKAHYSTENGGFHLLSRSSKDFRPPRHSNWQSLVASHCSDALLAACCCCCCCCCCCAGGTRRSSCTHSWGRFPRPQTAHACGWAARSHVDGRTGTGCPRSGV